MHETPVFADIEQRVRTASRILLVSDGRPDGDSIGSTVGFYHWVRTLGKTVHMFCAEPLPHALMTVDGAHDVTNDTSLFTQPWDLIITFDAGDLKHCGIDTLLPSTPTGYTLAVIDHHSTNQRYGDVNAVFTDACSTAELVYRFFQERGIPINDRMATALLIGICHDTTCFSNSGTTSAGTEAASALIACGARFLDVVNSIFKTKTTDGLKLWGLALSRLHHNKTLDVVTTYFLEEDLRAPGADEAVDGMSNFLNSVCGDTDTILVLKQAPNKKIKGSLRSVRRDISRVAKLLGGGGHKKASGFVIDGTLVETPNGVRVY